MKRQGKYYQGFFYPKNPQKYRGNPGNIIYRSSWELKVLKYLDTNPNVLEYSSEELIIPYVSPLDSRKHRYFPDFLVKLKDREGNIKTTIIEVKPKVQTIEPKVKKRITQRYINEVLTWTINQAKWKAADSFCKDKGWTFQLMTEDHIYKKRHK